MNQQTNAPAEQLDWVEEDEISLIDLATTLGEQKKLVFGLPALAAVVSIIVSLLLPPIFTAETSLLPPSGNSGGGGAAAALASLGALGGLAGGLGIKTPDEQYVAMLQSHSVMDQLIERFNLLKHYDVKYRKDVYEKLKKIAVISSDKKSGIISISVDDKDPKFAAELANGYVDALSKLLDRVAVTDAQQRRQFFETQFEKAKEKLSDSEVNLKKVQETTGLIQIDGQAKATIEAVANVRAEIAKREVQLTAMRTFATAENPDYKRIQGELAGLKVQLAKLEKGNGDDGGIVSTKNLPETGLEYVRALRDVKYNEAIYEIMAKQFELAKIDEAKEGATLQQLDKAVPPEKKSKPKRALIVILSTLAAGFLAVLISLLRGAMQKAEADPETLEKLQNLKQAWRL
ncbi:GumC family protein [Limnobacter litoralis]|uniref:Transport-related membrane protein n=1 Tax=Limnobacter litoralis TaxID=481366 RepID=A0ABQ5YSJ3_9BURK|nr:GNVR domain-containing protein [Limnobacter litoralis]GLR27027.1 transport-related membrane protein [Limnobacter litoralis]